MGIEKLDDDSLALVVGGSSIGAVAGGVATDPAIGAMMPDLTAMQAELVRQTNAVIAQMLAEQGRALVSGTAGSDVLLGSNRNEVFVGGAGADIMIGMNGENTYRANDGDRAGDIALGGDNGDTYVWAPGSGNDLFVGGGGTDTLALQNVNGAQILEGLRIGGVPIYNLPHHGLIPHTVATADGYELRLFNFQGQPQTFSGTFAIGGEVLTFSQTERITIPR